MKESSIIKELYRGRRRDSGLDDCFFFEGKYLITTDTIAEGTHFKHEWSSPVDIACKLIEVNVSDIAASGGLPRVAFLNLGLSRFSEKNNWLKPFLKQLHNKLLQYKIQLEGGDTYFSDKTNLTLTLIGETKKPILRHTGSKNDLVYMSGSIGLSLLGYKLLADNIQLPLSLKKEALNKHLQPSSKLEMAKHLTRKYKISAMMDITDGLIQDSGKLALASNLRMDIEIEKIPRLAELQAYLTLDDILSSGEELELLFLSKEKIESTKNFPVSCIGKVTVGLPKVYFTLDGKSYKPQKKGFLHFQ